MSTVATKPSTVWYWVAAFIALAGVVGAVIWGLTTVLSIGDRVAEFPRSSVPGQLTAPLSEAGSYAVYYEAADTDNVPALDIQVTDPTGTVVTVDRFAGDLRYEHAGTVSRAVATFAAQAPGEYVVAASGAAPGSATFSVGSQLVTGYAAVVGAVVLLFAAPIVASIVALTTLVLRNRNATQQGTAAPARRTPAGVA